MVLLEPEIAAAEQTGGLLHILGGQSSISFLVAALQQFAERSQYAFLRLRQPAELHPAVIAVGPALRVEPNGVVVVDHILLVDHVTFVDLRRHGDRIGFFLL